MKAAIVRRINAISPHLDSPLDGEIAAKLAVSSTDTNDGLLSTRTDGNGTSTTYFYDLLNRITGITHSGANSGLSPTITRCYNGQVTAGDLTCGPVAVLAFNNGNGAFEDNDSGGQSCADVDKADKKLKPTVTVYGGPNAPAQEVNEALRAFKGSGPKQIEYGPYDPFTISFKKSAGMDAIKEGLRSNCSDATGAIPVGTLEAFENTVIDGIFGRAGLHTPQAQLGAFNTSFSRDNGRVDVTVTNPISVNSLLFHLPEKVGFKNPTSGSFGTVHQTLRFTVPDPCGAK